MEKIKNYYLHISGLFLIAIIWGSGFSVTKVALDSGIEPYAMIGIRFFFAFFLMLFFLKYRKIELKDSDIKTGFLIGIILFVAFAFQTLGAAKTTASKNAFITGANVVIVPFIYWLISKKKPKMIIYFTSILCFIGIGILSIENGIAINIGDILTMGCAIFFAVHIAFMGHILKKADPLVINCFQMLGVATAGILCNFIFEEGSIIHKSFTIPQLGSLGYLIIFNTFVCFLIQTYSQKYIEPSKVAIIISTEMVFGAIFSIFFLGDEITLRLIVGGIIIFFAILISELKGN